SLKSFLFTLLFVAFLIFLNYTVGIERRIRVIRPWPLSLLSFYFFYGFVLFFSWALQYTFGNRPSLSGNLPLGVTTLPYKKRFLLLLLTAPLYFACKMIHWDLSLFIPSDWSTPWKEYALIVLQLPGKLLLLFLLVYVYWKLEDRESPGGGAWTRALATEAGMADSGRRTAEMGVAAFFGLTFRGFRGRPYFLILLFLVPLIMLASTRPDFLHTYPR
ncbi:MAG: hypothetical protein ABUM51_07630, partial [Bacteroidota bacterium]